MKPKFSSRRYEPGDETAINDLYRHVTGRCRSEAAWRWQWMENPAGSSEMWVIEIEEHGASRIVGHHGVMPFRATIRGRSLLIGKTENTMVLPEVRHRILYPRFEKRFLAMYRDRFDALFSTRGPAAAIRLRRAMGYRPTEPILTAAFGRIIRSSAAMLRRRIGGGTSRVPAPSSGPCGPGLIVDLDDSRFTDAWSRRRAAPTDTLELSKDLEGIDWRYRRHPSGIHRGALLDDAVVVFHRPDHASIRIDELEMLDGRASDSVAARVWRQLWSMATSMGASLLMRSGPAWALPDAATIRSSGLRRIRLMPSRPTEEDAMPVLLVPRDDRRLSESDRWRIDAFAFEGPAPVAGEVSSR